ncbi:hypothetical protein ACQPZQ_33415 [Pseudonocardia sp. CA-142604]|uniref:hypothetical protein n=1 Tax=Pseudonocardia sp. CA-142604 TaxID=3240024 RepID=UPI003D8BAA76
MGLSAQGTVVLHRGRKPAAAAPGALPIDSFAFGFIRTGAEQFRDRPTAVSQSVVTVKNVAADRPVLQAEVSAITSPSEMIDASGWVGRSPEFEDRC